MPLDCQAPRGRPRRLAERRSESSTQPSTRRSRRPRLLGWIATSADCLVLPITRSYGSAAAAALAAAGGRPGQRAAVNGLASVAVTSAVVNLLLKPLSRRRRPDRRTNDVPIARRVTMPRSTSFPSGHAASAFAFATGVGIALPRTGLPLTATAALVAYSRVHTGVHYPSDAIAGSVIGAGLAPRVVAALDHQRPM